MDLYVLDSLFRHKSIYDEFESLIWTERWNRLGDFELEIKSTLETRTIFVPGTRLAMNKSQRIMTVETVEDRVSDNGEEMLWVSGRSLELLLENRVAVESMTSAPDDVWYIDATQIGVPREMFTHVVENGMLDPNDDVPAITQRFPDREDDTLYTVIWMVIYTQKLDTLYNAIRGACVAYNFGFRIIRDPDTAQLYFEVYYSNNRTTRQTFFTPVIFGVSLGSIQNTTEFSSIADYKNVAYVFSDQGNAIVYADGEDPESGLDRRAMIVHVSVPPGETDVNWYLETQGKEALKRQERKLIFEGELNAYNEYVYDVDYGLGDLVEMRNRDGVISYKRVTEQIFVDDANGERSYPTLSAGMFEDINTWASYENDAHTWEDFTTEEWVDL